MIAMTNNKKRKGLVTESLGGIADSLGFLFGSGLDSIVALSDVPTGFVREAMRQSRKKRGF